MVEKYLAINIEDETDKNVFYRRVIHTSKYSQLVLMNIPPFQEIGNEVHPNTDQFIRIESGTGYAVLNGNNISIYDGVSLSIDAGTYHNIVNTSNEPLKLYTIYSPPHHPPDELILYKND